jgi:hypothetical protein
MVSGLESAFPGLRGTGWHISSNADAVYNCIAWAANDTTAWWWPSGPGKTFWPDGVRHEVTLEAFREAFATLNYAVCAGEELEPGFEKVALFADEDGTPTHAARQLPNGRWTSKLGRSVDIEHGLHDLEGVSYGAVVLVMRRSSATPSSPEAV